MLVALYKPEIPPNTGNIGRLCVALNLPLRIVGPPSFSLTDAALKRAGLDYWPYLNFKLFLKLRHLKAENPHSRIVAFTKEGKHLLWEFRFLPNDILLFGNESKGLPPKALKCAEATVRIPMWGPVRSLNLSNSVAVVAYEASRQLANQLPPPSRYQRQYYRPPASKRP